MDVSKIISISRRQTNTSIWQINDTDYLDYLNIVYKEIFSRLVVNSKKYTRQTYGATLVANQSEYTYPLPSVSVTWLKSLLDVYIDYGDWEVKAKIYDTFIGWLDEYTDKQNPVAITRDWSVFLYPTPIATWSIRIEWKYIPIDLTTTTTSSNIKLASEYHEILIMWLNIYIFWEKQLYEKQWVQRQMFEEWIKRMQMEWAMETESWYTEQLPDLSSHE